MQGPSRWQERGSNRERTPRRPYSPKPTGMLRSNAVRKVFALSAAAGLIAMIVAACTDESTNVDGTPDSGIDPTTIGTGVCPIVPPRINTTCLLPEGTTCAFACGSSIVVCQSGNWRLAGNPPPRPPCPDPAPAADTPCPACWPSAVTCRYGSEDCTAPDASTNRAIASCPDGKWRISFSPCADAGDAGSNVQGDADADAD